MLSSGKARSGGFAAAAMVSGSGAVSVATGAWLAQANSSPQAMPVNNKRNIVDYSGHPTQRRRV